MPALGLGSSPGLVMFQAKELVEDPRSKRRRNTRPRVGDADRHGLRLPAVAGARLLSALLRPAVGVYFSAFEKMLSKTERNRTGIGRRSAQPHSEMNIVEVPCASLSIDPPNASRACRRCPRLPGRAGADRPRCASDRGTRAPFPSAARRRSARFPRVALSRSGTCRRSSASAASYAAW